MIKKIGITDDPKEFCRPEISFPGVFRRHVYLRDQSIEVMRDILQLRYLRSNVAHKQLAPTSLILHYWRCGAEFQVTQRYKSGQYKTQTADCRLQTADRVQNAD